MTEIFIERLTAFNTQQTNLLIWGSNYMSNNLTGDLHNDDVISTM